MTERKWRVAKGTSKIRHNAVAAHEKTWIGLRWLFWHVLAALPFDDWYSQPTQPAQPIRIRESASADLAASQCSWMNVAQLPSLGIFVSRYISNNMERIFQIWAIGQTKIWSWSKQGDWKRMASSLYPCFDDFLGWIWVNRWPDSVARCCKWVESRSQIRWPLASVKFALPRWGEKRSTILPLSLFTSRNPGPLQDETKGFSKLPEGPLTTPVGQAFGKQLANQTSWQQRNPYDQLLLQCTPDRVAAGEDFWWCFIQSLDRFGNQILFFKDSFSRSSHVLYDFHPSLEIKSLDFLRTDLPCCNKKNRESSPH